MKPSPEHLRKMDVRSLREVFEISLQEAQRLKAEQRVVDAIALIPDEPTRSAMLDILYLVTGRT